MLKHALGVDPRGITEHYNSMFATEEPFRGYDWRQDALLIFAGLAGIGAFLGPFSDPRARYALAAVVGLIGAYRAARVVKQRRDTARISRDERAIWLLRGLTIRCLANDFQGLLVSDENPAWLAQGIASANTQIQQFHAMLSPAFEHARDVVALILQKPAHTSEEVRIETEALSRAVKGIHDVVRFAVLAAHAAPAQDIHVTERGKANRAYLRWQAFEIKLRGAAEPQTWSSSTAFKTLEALPAFK
jgi:hypothetical protein